jgi:hypothetical protein
MNSVAEGNTVSRMNDLKPGFARSDGELVARISGQ